MKLTGRCSTPALILAFFCCMFSSLSYAQQLEEHLKVIGPVRRAWIVIIDADHSKVVSAAYEANGEETVVRASLNALPDGALVSAALELVSGEVYSTPLHSIWHRELPFSNGAQKLSEESRMRDLVAAYQRELERLEGEHQLVTLEKRREAGLDEVDKIYEKIALIETERAELKKVRAPSNK